LKMFCSVHLPVSSLDHRCFGNLIFDLSAYSGYKKLCKLLPTHSVLSVLAVLNVNIYSLHRITRVGLFNSSTKQWSP
jgi:hypothetical protein